MLLPLVMVLLTGPINHGSSKFFGTFQTFSRIYPTGKAPRSPGRSALKQKKEKQNCSLLLFLSSSQREKGVSAGKDRLRYSRERTSSPAWKSSKTISSNCRNPGKNRTEYNFVKGRLCGSEGNRYHSAAHSQNFGAPTARNTF